MDDNQLPVWIGRTNVVPLSLGFDVEGDELHSEIRTESGDLIATWQILYENDANPGQDGELILVLDDSVTSLITAQTGLMDMKRISNGEPLVVWDTPIEVVFKKPVTQ